MSLIFFQVDVFLNECHFVVSVRSTPEQYERTNQAVLPDPTENRVLDIAWLTFNVS